jgi:hypothetical protein
MLITDRVSTSFLRTVAIIYCYVFAEWLFFVTKPSYLDRLGYLERVEVLLIASLYFVMNGVLAYAALALIQKVIPPGVLKKLPFNPNVIVAAVFATTLVVLWIDNFFYSIFKIGIITTESYQVAIYAIAVLGLLCWFLRKFTLGNKVEWDVWAKNVFVYGLSSILLVSLLVSALRLYTSDSVHFVMPAGHSRDYPNILLFASDGIEADKLSMYGYHRQTTPNLAQLSGQGLIATAALSNAARTTGSTTSMLTGKLPTTTKVLFPPQVLIGQDSYEHLPGILRNLGYRTFQETIRYYGDSPDLNMRNGFQIANRRATAESQGQFVQQFQYSYSTSILLVERLVQRAEERFLHLSGISKMLSPYDAVNNRAEAPVYGITDQSRVDYATQFINESDVPFFAHIHLMESHCCQYRPRERIFSSKHEGFNAENSGDFLDDLILESDRQFGEIIDQLKTSGKFESTIIVYSSDHTEGWRTDRLLPLIFLFPGGQHKGVIEQTVQLADVAPTLLNYLKMDVPQWMEGDSLISKGKPDPLRPIYSFSGIERQTFTTATDTLSEISNAGPPLYGLKRMGLTICHKRYVLNLRDQSGEMSDIKNHPRPCENSQLPDLTSALAMIKEHLIARDFGVQ